MNVKKIIVPAVVGIVLFGAGFWSGIYYQKKTLSSATTGNPPFGSDFNGTPPTDGTGRTPPSGGGARSGGPGGGGVSGEIVTKSDDNIIVKKSDGSTVIVYFDDSTTVSKNQTASASDLTVGTSVQAMGTTNTDKSVTSKSIMIQPKTSS